jgi:hypothetical protein
MMLIQFLAQTSGHSTNPFGGLILLVFIAVICIAALNLFKSRAKAPRARRLEEAWSPPAADAATFPFLRKKYFFSAAERSFYEVLRRAAGEQIYVFAKVRLADIVHVARGTGSWQTHFNRIQSKHIDFLLCDRQKIAPLLAVELDDSSHDAHARKSRDQLVDAVCEAAGLPMIRITAQRAYTLESLRMILDPYICQEFSYRPVILGK